MRLRADRGPRSQAPEGFATARVFFTVMCPRAGGVRGGIREGRCCMNTLWGWGRASWAGCGPDVRRGGYPEIDADHGIFGR